MKKILIIEDELQIAELEKDYLELSDFEVTIETDGTEGEKKAMSGEWCRQRKRIAIKFTG